MAKLLRNRIKCLKCGDIVESIERHDMQFCGCGKVAVDGGLYCQRRIGNPHEWEEMSVFEGSSNTENE